MFDMQAYQRQANALVPTSGEAQRLTLPMSRLRRMDTRHASTAKAARRRKEVSK